MATLDYLSGLKADAIAAFPPNGMVSLDVHREKVRQFPVGTMVAMIRRPLTVTRANTLSITPLTELVQIRVYQQIPPDRPTIAELGQQAVQEFVLDRSELFSSRAGLHPLEPNSPPDSFDRDNDPFIPKSLAQQPLAATQLKTCIACHQAPGVYSMLSMERGLRTQFPDFRPFAWDVEVNLTVRAKVREYSWGLLQGQLEARGVALEKLVK